MSGFGLKCSTRSITTAMFGRWYLVCRKFLMMQKKLVMTQRQKSIIFYDLISMPLVSTMWKRITSLEATQSASMLPLGVGQMVYQKTIKTIGAIGSVKGSFILMTMYSLIGLTRKWHNSYALVVLLVIKPLILDAQISGLLLTSHLKYQKCLVMHLVYSSEKPFFGYLFSAQ